VDCKAADWISDMIKRSKIYKLNDILVPLYKSLAFLKIFRFSLNLFSLTHGISTKNPINMPFPENNEINNLFVVVARSHDQTRRSRKWKINGVLIGFPLLHILLVFQKKYLNWRNLEIAAKQHGTKQ